MKFSNVLFVGAASIAAAQSHNHFHRHPARYASPAGNDPANLVDDAPIPVVTVYELNGHKINPDDAQEGLRDGRYALLGDKINALDPPKPSTSPTTTPSSSTPSSSPTPSPTPKKPAAKFFEKPNTSPTPRTTSEKPPASSSTPELVKSSAAEPPSSDTSSPSGGSRVDSDFPDGKHLCSDFPSKYGAIPVDWLGTGGWSGIQKVPEFNPGIDSAISLIRTAISGQGCSEKCFCSYACPAGYQKIQWPEAQGSTGQSIGGIYCGEDGLLHLTRKGYKKLCEKCVDNVKVKNKLEKNVAMCRTDYPGTECETVPLNTEPGKEYDLCNPDQTTYYHWKHSPTSAQYYINNAGVPPQEACVWGDPGSNKGNWAPVNLGLGRAADGVTYISLFQNAPTNTDGKLNFNIAIKGDVSGDCGYKDGHYVSNGNISPSGCTVGIPSGGHAVVEFY